MKYFLIFLLIETVVSMDLIGRIQSTSVKGKLSCNGKPLRNAEVKLMESDNSIIPGFFDTDDIMATGHTDNAGSFVLSGWTKEVTEIEPYISVLHDCIDEDKDGQRVLRINVPSSYISKGERPTKTYDAGNLEISGHMPGEKRTGFGRK